MRAGKSEPIWVLASSRGIPNGPLVMSSRITVPPRASVGPRMPPSTLVTNSSLMPPRSRAVMSQGPWMPWPVNVSRTMPWLSSTIRQPKPESTVPLFVVGSDPTMTQPPRSATRAVVRPTPPGQALPRSPIWANSDAWPDGVTCTIVLPVPWMFPESLKLLTSTLPCCRLPTLRGTTATPYGLTSPFCGIVEATTARSQTRSQDHKRDQCRGRHARKDTAHRVR